MNIFNFSTPYEVIDQLYRNGDHSSNTFGEEEFFRQFLTNENENQNGNGNT